MLTGDLEASFLQFLMRMIGAKRVLELGTFVGYSALALAAGLPPTEGCKVITCEIDPQAAKIAEANWSAFAELKAKVRDNLDSFCRIIYPPSRL